MKRMNEGTIAAINQALLFQAGTEYERPGVRPWQYIQMEYERVGMIPPPAVPQFRSREDAEIWLCLDAAYNTRLREVSWPQAV